MSGDKVNYLPSRHLKITVDKEAVVRNGIVPENMKDRIVDEIVWTIPSSVNYLYKNDLMLLDFFASNDWTRAVYFTSLSDIKNILDIDKYLHQEGLAHRFMPVVAESYYKDAGGVFVDGSYELLMADDKAIDKGEKMAFDLTPEQLKNTKHRGHKAPTVYKHTKRERKADNDKRFLVELLKNALTTERIAEVTITNPERQIDFMVNERKFRIVLSAPRS